MNTGVIIQARSGSTRLPQKVLLPFWKTLSILDIQIIQLKQYFPNLPICIATTDNEEDHPIIELAKRHDISAFAGDEKNVLNRFIQAAKQEGYDDIIRVCSDNPFISLQLLDELLNSQSDYCTHKVNGTPSMLTHLGIFTEKVSLETLIKSQTICPVKEWLQHVTYFAYQEPSIFKLNWLAVPAVITKMDNLGIRLTIDTQEDFDTAALIFHKLGMEGSQDLNLVLKTFENLDSGTLSKMRDSKIHNKK
jgi:spore coat polysaccharide biosynthesis protein SpsF